MLETNYVLLRCDEWSFLERDEYENEYRSVSWIQSIQPTLDLFGLEAKSYPHGSISANSHYYEALRNYFGGAFPLTPEFTYLREGLKNLLILRRDDSSDTLTYLFGSYHKIDSSKGGREHRTFRRVEVSLRHSATALWILCEESSGKLSKPLQDSLVAFLDRVKRYLTKNEDWQKDGYKHLTISSAMKTCEAILNRFSKSDLTERAQKIASQCQEALFSRDCFIQSINGDFFWAVPDVKKSRMAKYEFYLNAFVLTQVPEVLKRKKARSILQTMLSNQVRSDYGEGIPLHRLINFSKQDEAKPDFGATASCLFLLWYSINNLGDADWLKYCEENFRRLMSFCLNVYDKSQYYLLPHSENNSKILLMPRFNFLESRIQIIDSYIYELKRAISLEMKDHNGKLSKNLEKIKAPPGLEGVKDILMTWEITKYWKKQTQWTFNSPSELGQFLGGFAGSFTDAFLRTSN